MKYWEQPKFGELLKEKRDKLGWTQIQAAKFLGVGRSTYIAWEISGKKPGRLKGAGALSLLAEAKPTDVAIKFEN